MCFLFVTALYIPLYRIYFTIREPHQEPSSV